MKKFSKKNNLIKPLSLQSDSGFIWDELCKSCLFGGVKGCLNTKGNQKKK